MTQRTLTLTKLLPCVRSAESLHPYRQIIERCNTDEKITL